MRLLVIEDEPRIAEVLGAPLQRAGFVVDFVRLCAEETTAGCRDKVVYLVESTS